MQQVGSMKGGKGVMAERLGIVTGGSGLALGCAVGCLAVAGTAWLWAPAFAVTWLGAYLLVRSRGCTAPGDAQCSAPPALLDRRARRARLLQAAAIGALTSAVGALAYLRLAELWPLVTVGAWFALSFAVAGVSGYPGCPETGAVLSLLRRRNLPTSCPPLEN